MKKLLILVCCLNAGMALSQGRLTLSDAINLALKNSLDIQLAKNNVEISTINNHPGVAGALPTVTATANDNEQIVSINQKFPDPSRNTTRNNVSSNNLSVGVTGTILLSNGYRVVTTKKRLNELVIQNRYLLDAQIQNTMAAVATRYYDVVRQQEFIKTIEQSIDVFQKRLDILMARKEAGLSNNADIFQARLDLNAQVQLKQQQALVIQQGKTDLLNLLFLNPDSTITIQDTIIVERNLSLENIRTKLKDNPQLLSANEQIKINELIEKETEALGMPTLRANTGYNFNNTRSGAGFILQNQSYGPFISLNLSIPIYNGTAFKRQQQVAEINSKNAVLQKETLVQTLETGAVRTYQAYKNALQQLETEVENYKLSMQLVDLVLKRFELNQATIIDVRQAQQSFETSGFRLLNLNYTAKLAEIELKRLANQITP
ncbi:MAG: TolC family protein [Sediminibacterium sp.]|jgi:outer membrane protein|uniref:TolC family protein n=1 Tax=Sediminibacterium sp. TaxID=1917865 RepID=UPI002AB9F4BD|nr:TolC family protein [Sediminibacterium sp.]MDZ4072870.1 TolC family protein [Sediminibacterium sp.]